MSYHILTNQIWILRRVGDDEGVDDGQGVGDDDFAIMGVSH